jgi:hypothetical protein
MRELPQLAAELRSHLSPLALEASVKRRAVSSAEGVASALRSSRWSRAHEMLLTLLFALV